MSFSIIAANIRLRELIDESLEEYQRSKSKVERSALVSRIIGTVQGEKGRFIRQDPKTKRWFQVRSRTTREKVGQAIRAALKKREQHDSQFVRAKKHQGTSSLLFFGAEEPTGMGRNAPTSPSPSHKLRETHQQSSSFSSSLSHTRMTQLRHDRGSQNLQHYFDAIPLPGAAGVSPQSACSPVGESLYTEMKSLYDLNYGNTEPNRYANQQEIRNPSNSLFRAAHGMDDLFSSRPTGNNYLQRDAAGVLPHINREARANAKSLLKLQQESRGFPSREGLQRQQQFEAVAAPATAAAAARVEGSSWYPSSSNTLFPETAAMFSGNSSPGLDNGHFHSIADAHQTASATMRSVALTSSLHATIPLATASPLSLSSTEEEGEAKGGSPTIREGLHEN